MVRSALRLPTLEALGGGSAGAPTGGLLDGGGGGRLSGSRGGTGIGAGSVEGGGDRGEGRASVGSGVGREASSTVAGTSSECIAWTEEEAVSTGASAATNSNLQQQPIPTLPLPRP